MSYVDTRRISAINRVLRDPNLWPPETLGYIRDWLTLNPIPIPVEQVDGFSRYTAYTNEVAAGETTSSTSYTDLSTSGPSITGLSGGTWVITIGADIGFNAGNNGLMSISVNGATAVDADCCRFNTGSAVGTGSVARTVVKTLSGSNNSITCKYRVTGGTGTFERRYLIAQRVAT